MTAVRFHSNVEGDLAPLADVKPHPENPNNGDVEALMESLVENGCYRSIVASRRTGEVLAGHTLHEALSRLGQKWGPIEYVDAESYEDEIRILLVDNQSAKRAYMDPGLEYTLLKRLSETERGLVGTGYEVDDMLALALEMETRFIPFVEDDDEEECVCRCGNVHTRGVNP